MSRTNAAPMPEFDGKNWESFEDDFQDICLALGYSGRRKVRFMVQCTKPELRDEIRQTCGYEDGDWSTLVKEIQVLYPTQTKQVSWTGLHELVNQGCTAETLGRFITRFEYISRQIGRRTQVPLKDKLTLFLKALLVTLRQQVMTVALSDDSELTYSEVRDHAVRLATHQVQLTHEIQRLDGLGSAANPAKGDMNQVKTVKRTGGDSELDALRRQMQQLVVQVQSLMASRGGSHGRGAIIFGQR